MKMNEQIRVNRKELGLTQEQVADYLGVSTPAVNKWEKGATYPDITLLPALARLLKIDLNTLFFFHEELTELEIKTFIKELIETAQGGDFEAAFETANKKIREYPRCDSLIYSSANALDAALTLSKMSAASKEEYEKKIMLWYERAAESEDESIKNAAVHMLVGKYIKSSDYDKAGTLIEKIPESDSCKTSFQVDILMHDGKTDEAAVLMEGRILEDLTKIQTCLLKLMDIELKAENHERAAQIAEVARNMVSLFGLWGYSAFVPHLKLALYEKDADRSMAQIKALFEAAHEPWNMEKSPLFYRIAQKSFADVGKYFIPAFISELQTSSEYDFLRDREDFLKLIEMNKNI